MDKKELLKIILLAIFVIMLFAIIFNITGCAKGCQKKIKHFRSSVLGLNRSVTLYDYNGELIKQWQGRFQVEKEGDGSVLSFIKNGKEIKISGGIVTIEEL